MCGLFGYSKQAYYKRKSEKGLTVLEKAKVKSLVLNVRHQLPKLGTRKLYHMLSPEFSSDNIKIGRDKLFDFLREENMLISKRKKYHKTTNSSHWLRKYPNQIKNLDINRPEQVWVADITYLKVKGSHYYLHLLTDAYSKRIVGYELCDNLKTESTLKALQMGLQKRKYSHALIHHSDRGLQYCSKEYTDILRKNKVKISMTQAYDPYENAIAERVNGILKDEFDLDIHFESEELLRLQVVQSIALYNQLRPHSSIEFLTPNQAHKQKKIKIKKWSKKKPVEMNQLV